MPRNGQGIYTLPVGNPVITGTTITSTWGNTTMQDIANALTGSVASDGQTTMSGPLNMGSNRINNVDNPVLPQDAATMDYVDTLVGDLGTMARQNADNVQITGGSIIGVFLDLSGTTGQMFIPVGTSAQRTNSPKLGLFRYNTDMGGFYEGWSGTFWSRFQTVKEGEYTIEYLLVAGGGGGGSNSGGGGGGGGFIDNTITAIPGTTYDIIIGGGGTPASSGSNSVIQGIATAIGGGGGRSYGPAPGLPGGSGGGGSGTQDGESTAGGNGTPGQGNNGGGSNNHSGAGGGGGGETAGGGGKYGVVEGGDGGTGHLSAITGTPTRYCGGGGGAAGYYGTSQGGPGGAGGGGAGAPTGSGGQAAGVNTGGGGGGGGAGVGPQGGAGGSGICIMAMLTAYYSGTTTGSPLVDVVGDKTILYFKNNGSYTA